MNQANANMHGFRRIRRQAYRYMSSGFKHKRLSAKDRVKMIEALRKLKKAFTLALLIAAFDMNSPVLPVFVKMSLQLKEIWFAYRFAWVPLAIRTIHFADRNIDSFTDEECYLRFRFVKADLRRLFVLLELSYFRFY